MCEKQISKKFFLISFSVLASLVLCMCAIIGSSKSAEAKANPSNDFSVDMKCSDGNSIYVFSQSLDIFQMCSEFAATDYIEKSIEEKLPGATLEYVPSESYYGKSTMGVTDVFGTLVILKVNIIQDGESMSRELELFFGMYDEPSEVMYSPLEYVNGLHVELPNLDDGAKGISMVDGNGYLFTDYPYSDAIDISGNVVDEAGNAVDGALVSLTSQAPVNEVPKPVLTVNGEFLFEDVEVSDFPLILNVEKEGYNSEPVTLTEADIIDGKITVTNLLLKTNVEPGGDVVNPGSEIAQTSDISASLVLILLFVAMFGCGVVLTRSLKNQK